MPESSESPVPTLATWSMLKAVLVLLMGALVIEIALAPHWTQPFQEPGTWILIGVVVGVALRGLGRVLSRRQKHGEALMHRLSLGVWIVTALGGLISLLF